MQQAFCEATIHVRLALHTSSSLHRVIGTENASGITIDSPRHHPFSRRVSWRMRAVALGHHIGLSDPAHQIASGF